MNTLKNIDIPTAAAWLIIGTAATGTAGYSVIGAHYASATEIAIEADTQNTQQFKASTAAGKLLLSYVTGNTVKVTRIAQPLVPNDTESITLGSTCLSGSVYDPRPDTNGKYAVVYTSPDNINVVNVLPSDSTKPTLRFDAGPDVGGILVSANAQTSQLLTERHCFDLPVQR